jgi:hypothetical protein
MDRSVKGMLEPSLTFEKLWPGIYCNEFMDIIEINKKYDNLKKLNIIKKIKNSYNVTITIMKNHSLYKYTIEQKIYSNMIHWYMDKYIYNNINIYNFTREEPITKTFHYIFGHNEKQHLPRKIEISSLCS